jgi:ShET2 enterotoxin, N-terminal region
MTINTTNPKTNPYFATKHTDDTSKNFNGVYQNPTPNVHPKDATFFCRHIAVLAAQMAKTPDFKNDDFFRVIQSPEAPNKLAEISYEEFKRIAPHRVIVSTKDFGAYLLQAFQAVMAEGKLGGTFIVSSEDHVMKGTLKHKIKNNQPQYVVHIMDPNLSTTHVRCAKSDPTEFASFSLEDFLDEDCQKEYFPGTEQYPLAVFSHNIPPIAWHNENAQYLSSEVMSQRLFFAAAQENFPETIRQFEKHSAEELQKLLSHKANLDCPALYQAMQNSNIAAVRELLNLIKTLPVTPSQTTSTSVSL